MTAATIRSLSPARGRLDVHERPTTPLLLLCIAEAPESTLREIGECVGVRERTVPRIVSDLVEEG